MSGLREAPGLGSHDFMLLRHNHSALYEVEVTDLC